MVCLHQEPDKPGDAVNYLKNTVGGTTEDKTTIEQLRTENTELKAKVKILMFIYFTSSVICILLKLAELESSQSSLQSRIDALEAKADTSAPSPAVAPEEAKVSPEPEPAPAVEAAEAVNPEPTPAAEATPDPVTEAAPAGEQNV